MALGDLEDFAALPAQNFLNPHNAIVSEEAPICPSDLRQKRESKSLPLEKWNARNWRTSGAGYGIHWPDVDGDPACRFTLQGGSLAPILGRVGICFMRDYHINIFFSEEDGGYIADIPDLAHCAAFGETPEQALGEVLKAKAAWIEAARAEGKPVPPPSFRPAIYQVTPVPA